MAALTQPTQTPQKAWYEDRVFSGGQAAAEYTRRPAERYQETRAATIRFIRSQIGIGTLAAAERARAPRLVDF